MHFLITMLCLAVLAAVTGTPFLQRDAELESAAPQLAREAQDRRHHVTKTMLVKFRRTVNCAGCFPGAGGAKPLTDACRDRIVEAIKADLAERDKYCRRKTLERCAGCDQPRRCHERRYPSTAGGQAVQENQRGFDLRADAAPGSIPLAVQPSPDEPVQKQRASSPSSKHALASRCT